MPAPWRHYNGPIPARRRHSWDGVARLRAASGRRAKPGPACASRHNRCCGSGFSRELLALFADAKSSRLPPLLPGSKGRLLCAVALELDLRGPSAAAESADKTRRACPVLDTGAPHMDDGRFPTRPGVLSLRQVSLHKQRKVDRKSVVEGKSVSVRVDLGGRRIIKK